MKIKIFTIIFFSYVLLFPTSTTNAQVSGGDVVASAIACISASHALALLSLPQAPTTGTSQTVKECGFDVAATSTKDAVLSSIIGSVYDWIEGGEGRGPTFLTTDVVNFQTNAYADQLLSLFLGQGSDHPALCNIASSRGSGFNALGFDGRNFLDRFSKTNLRQQLESLIGYNTFNNNDFSLPNYSCDVTRSTYDSLYTTKRVPTVTEFDNILRDYTNPRYNPFSAQKLATLKVEERLKEQKRALEIERIANEGLADQRDEECVTTSGNIIECPVTQSGAYVGDTLHQALGADFQNIVGADELSALFTILIGYTLGDSVDKILGVKPNKNKVTAPVINDGQSLINERTLLGLEDAQFMLEEIKETLEDIRDYVRKNNRRPPRGVCRSNSQYVIFCNTSVATSIANAMEKIILYTPHTLNNEDVRVVLHKGETPTSLVANIILTNEEIDRNLDIIESLLDDEDALTLFDNNNILRKNNDLFKDTEELFWRLENYFRTHSIGKGRVSCRSTYRLDRNRIRVFGRECSTEANRIRNTLSGIRNRLSIPGLTGYEIENNNLIHRGSVYSVGFFQRID